MQTQPFFFATDEDPCLNPQSSWSACCGAPSGSSSCPSGYASLCRPSAVPRPRPALFHRRYRDDPLGRSTKEYVSPCWHSVCGRIFCLGLCVIALPTIYLANRSDLSPGLVVLLFATIPLMASMLESRSGLTGAPALLGGLAGTAFLVRGSLSSSTSQAISLGGLVLIVVAIATVLVRAGKSLASANPPSSVLASVMVQMLTAGIVFAFYSLMFEHLQPVAWAGAQIAVVVILGAFGSAGAYCLFYVALRDLKVSQVSVVQWLIPAVGILETAILFKHLPEWGSLAGGMLSIGSAVVLLYAAKQGDTPLTLQITDAADQENARL